MNYTEDYGLLIGLVTAPFGKEKEFYEKEIKVLVNNYKEKQLRYHKLIHGANSSAKEKEFIECLYEPHAYCLFGNFDLAIFSLIDDYTLSNRNFHPYSYYIADSYLNKHSEQFKYQIITGPTPNISRSTKKPKEFLIDIAKKTFLAKNFPVLKNKSFPFIGITRLKLNNGLIIGSGARAVAAVQLLLKDTFQNFKENFNSNLKFVITESFGWNELTIVFFCDSLKSITDLIVQLREIPIKKLRNHINEKVYLEILQNSLINSLINTKKSDFEIEESHLFIKSFTNYGYDIDLLDKAKNEQNGKLTISNKFYKPDFNEDTFKLFTRWSIKPGHLNQVLNNFKNLKYNEPENVISFISGDEDYIFPPTSSSVTNLKDFYRLTVDSMISGDENPVARKINKHIRTTNTIPQFEYPFDELQRLVRGDNQPSDESHPKHFFIYDELKKYAFNLEELAEIRSLLYKCGASKLLREKVIKMYVNYNDGVRDPIMYVFFIELRPYLMQIRTNIRKYTKSFRPTLKHIHETLDKVTNSFEIAFKNRFLQSYRTEGITDFNIEVSGGYQQITSALDGAYKVLTETLGARRQKTSFVLIAGLSGVDSAMYNLRLNYFHIFQPSIFLAPLVKEAANQIFNKNKLSTNAQELKEYTKEIENLNELLNAIKKNSVDLGFEKLLDNCDINLLTSIRSDVISYLYGYNADTDLYSFWYWGYFFQMSTIYNFQGEIRTEPFIKFLIRYLVIIKNFDPEFEKGIITQLQGAKFYFPNGIIGLKKLFTRYFNTVSKFVDHLYEKKEINLSRYMSKFIFVAIMPIVRDITNHNKIESEDTLHEIMDKETDNLWQRMTKSKNFKKNKIREKRLENLRFLESGRLRSVGDTIKDLEENDGISSIFFQAIATRYTRIYQKYFDVKNSFNRSELFEYRKSLNSTGKLNSISTIDTHSLYLQIISYGYLKLLKENLLKHTNGSYVLLRYRTNKNSKGKNKGDIHLLEEINNSTPFEGNLLVDPMGGLFSTEISTRKEFYKYRSTLIRSLWDFSLKTKKELFQES